jgi:hypothetical protein
MSRQFRRFGWGLAAGAGFGFAAYAAYAAATWFRYAHTKPAHGSEADALLDRFMPVYEVAERHHIRVAAPASVALSAAADLNLDRSPAIRAIFKMREVLLHAQAGEVAHPHGLIPQMKALGWGVLAEIPGREIVMGAATQPWLADVRFRTLPSNEFASFQEPGYVKIAWTLRADPMGPAESIFRTETRVMTTDAPARAKCRRYWSSLSPGILWIRHIALRLVRKEAERCYLISARIRARHQPAMQADTP